MKIIENNKSSVDPEWLRSAKYMQYKQNESQGTHKDSLGLKISMFHIEFLP